MRGRLWLAVIGLLFLGVAPAIASGADWSAWLYDAESGHLVLVAADGTAASDLWVPLSQGFNQLPDNVAFSRSGALMAFVATNTDTGERQLVVYDTSAQLQKLLVNLPALDGHSLSYSGTAFNDNDTLLAFGHTPVNEGWRIDVFDLASGSIAYTLLEEATSAFEVIGDESQPLTPVIQRFEGAQITFTLAGGEGQERYSSFTWDVVTSGLTPAPAYFKLDLDVFPPTGELVFPTHEPDLASSFAQGAQNNALGVYDPDTNSAFPFYHDPERSLFWPRFVQNGERVFAAGLSAGSDAPGLFLIERDGTVISAIGVPGITSVHGLSDGLIYTLEIPGEQGDSVSLIYANTRDSDSLENSTPVWTGAPNAEYRIVWARDRRQVEAASLMAWAQLDEPERVGE